jgi:2-C-methyl-D-erythritol 4-phosphate cytidylyltransferase
MIASGVIVAAGRGERFGETGKIMAIVAGRPMLAWSLDAFQQCNLIRDIVIVAGEHTIAAIQELLATNHWPKVTSIVEGGSARSESVRRGLDQVASDIDVVAIHDAARPLLTIDLIVQSVNTAWRDGAAIVATPVTDTLKRANQSLGITETIDRSTIWAAQTPQAFRKIDLVNAFAQPCDPGATDEAMLFERIGEPVQLIPGSRWNMKVTVPEDLALVDFLMRQRLESI